jgi:uncharacterized protein
MADRGDRAQYFPAIERAHGQPVSFFLDQLARLDTTRYPEQIAFLREEHGFSRAHANAVVMTFRGKPSARRHDHPDDYFAGLDHPHVETARAIFAAIMERHPDLELVMAWNHPMLRVNGHYVFGLSVAKDHLTINPWSVDVLEAMRPRLAGHRMNKKTFTVPADWAVDAELLDAIVRARRAEITSP